MNKPHKKKKALPKPLLISGIELSLQVLECLTCLSLIWHVHTSVLRELRKKKTTHSERRLGYEEKTIPEGWLCNWWWWEWATCSHMGSNSVSPWSLRDQRKLKMSGYLAKKKRVSITTLSMTLAESGQLCAHRTPLAPISDKRNINSWTTTASCSTHGLIPTDTLELAHPLQAAQL